MVTAYGSLLGGGGVIQVHKAGDMAVVAVAWIINHIYGSNRAWPGPTSGGQYS